MEDARQFYRWHVLKGNGVALYDGSLARLEFDADCGYKPSFFDHKFKSIPEADLTTELFEMDLDAPYFFGFSFNGKPGGRVIIDREEAWDLVEDPYWQDAFSLRLYNAFGEELANRGLEFEEEIAERRLDRLAKRELTPFNVGVKEEPVKPKTHLTKETKPKKAKIAPKKSEKAEAKETKPVPKVDKKVETDKALDAYVTKTKNKLVTNEQKEKKLYKGDPFADEVQATIDALLAGERILETPIPVPVIEEPVLVEEPVIVEREFIPEPILEPVEEMIVEPLDPEIRAMHKGPLRKFWRNIKADKEISTAQEML